MRQWGLGLTPPGSKPIAAQAEIVTGRSRSRSGIVTADEFNNVYRQQFVAHGMRVVGTSPDGALVEDHRTTRAPVVCCGSVSSEFKSQPTRPQGRLFAGFVAPQSGGTAFARNDSRSRNRRCSTIFAAESRIKPALK